MPLSLSKAELRELDYHELVARSVDLEKLLDAIKSRLQESLKEETRIILKEKLHNVTDDLSAVNSVLRMLNRQKRKDGERS
jgi:hypothetical protein